MSEQHPPDPYGQPQPPYGQQPPPPSPYGQPAPPPYGQQPPPPSPYGQPAPPPYGEPTYQQPAPNPYGQPQYGAPAYGYGYGAPAAPYAHWGKRVGAYLIDSLILAPFYGLAMVAMFATTSEVTKTETDYFTGEEVTRTVNEPSGIGVAIALVLYAVMIGISVWNSWIRQGRTGYSIGKQVLGIRLVKESTLDSPGIGLNIGRLFAHILDAMPCYLGFLWPLWDDKRQTFADKICSTVVVDQPKPKA